MRRANRALLALAVGGLLGTTACGSARPQTNQEPATTATRVLTNEEMTQAGVLGTTAYEAVLRLRPGFLIDRTAGRRTSSQPIMVSVNGGQISAVATLNSIPASTVAEIRYLSIGEAAQRFGSRATGPVILVMMMTR